MAIFEKEEESSLAFHKKYGGFITRRVILGDLCGTNSGKLKRSLKRLPNHLYFAKFIVSQDSMTVCSGQFCLCLLAQSKNKNSSPFPS